MFVQLLNADSTLTAALAGRIYNGKRSEGRPTEECIVVNTPWVNHRQPQQGYTNINIHVPDRHVVIDDTEQTQPDTARLQVLTAIVLDVLEAANIYGVSIEEPQENLMQEPTHAEHYNNIRVDWINGTKN